jgi:hypothetical protein
VSLLVYKEIAMSTLTQSQWRRLSLATLGFGLAAVTSSSTRAQLPDVGGAVGGAVQNAGQAVPNVNQAVPSVHNSTRQNVNVNAPNVRVPDANVRTPNVNVPNVNVPNVRTPNVNGALKQSANAGAAVDAALAPNHFRSPVANSRFLGANVPVSLEGVADASRLGLAVDTRQNHLRVASVAANSLGATAGLRAGDQIVAVNRTWIRSYDNFTHELSAALRDQTHAAWVLVNREGRQQWINLNSSANANASVGAAAATGADASVSANGDVHTTAKPMKRR